MTGNLILARKYREDGTILSSVLKGQWEAPELIWETPIKGVRLVRIRTPHDLVLWGSLMGHSGGRYQKWVCDTPIWQFFTFLDEDNFPHVTIHAKSLLWFFSAHPDDKYAIHAREWTWGYGPAPQDDRGQARFWLPSTSYESFDKDYPAPIRVNTHRLRIMSAGHTDRDKLRPAEQELVKMWYGMVKEVEPANRT